MNVSERKKKRKWAYVNKEIKGNECVWMVCMCEKEEKRRNGCMWIKKKKGMNECFRKEEGVCVCERKGKKEWEKMNKK
jgi:hypothetical protein